MKAVIFDLFETLVTENALPDMTREEEALFLGADPTAFAAAWKAGSAARKTGKLSPADALRECAPEANEGALKADFLRRRRRLRALFEKPDGEILLLLSDLKRRGYALGLVSNCDEEDAAALKVSLLSVYPDAQALSCETGLLKPDPQAYLAAAQMLRTAPEECLYIGDGEVNGENGEMAGAAKAGMKPLRAAWFRDNKSGDYPVLTRLSDLYAYL